jgi:translation initiation factor IF-1
MRVHPISLALRYLQGHKTIRGKQSPFGSVADAALQLREATGQDFGEDAIAWSQWLRSNRKVYYRTLSPGIWATVTSTGTGGQMPWRVKTDDGRDCDAVITARIQVSALKAPTLQTGDRIHVQLHPLNAERCSVNVNDSPIVWIARQAVKTES